MASEPDDRSPGWLGELDAETLLSELGIRRVRRVWAELRFSCPFDHSETGKGRGDLNPSASMDCATTRWWCFTCGRGGNAITLVEQVLDLDRAAARRLLSELGAKLVATPEAVREREQVEADIQMIRARQHREHADEQCHIAPGAPRGKRATRSEMHEQMAYVAELLRQPEMTVESAIKRTMGRFAISRRTAFRRWDKIRKRDGFLARRITASSRPERSTLRTHIPSIELLCDTKPAAEASRRGIAEPSALRPDEVDIAAAELRARFDAMARGERPPTRPVPAAPVEPDVPVDDPPRADMANVARFMRRSSPDTVDQDG